MIQQYPNYTLEEYRQCWDKHRDAPKITIIKIDHIVILLRILAALRKLIKMGYYYLGGRLFGSVVKT